MNDERMKLSDLCNKVESEMRKMGYTEDAIKRYRKAWAELQAFSPDDYYDDKTSANFLLNKCKIEINNPDMKFSKSQLYIIRSVRVLSEYKCFQTFSERGELCRLLYGLNAIKHRWIRFLRA